MYWMTMQILTEEIMVVMLSKAVANDEIHTKHIKNSKILVFQI